jgi:lysophospholipase L1-like esterase
MRRLSVICCVLVGFAVCAQEPDPARWKDAIAKFEKEDEAKPFPKGGVVFTGSSSIAGWADLPSYFPEHKVLNRGFGGSILPDVNHYVERTVIKHEPKTVVLFCGGNDIARGHTPERVFADFKTFCSKVHAKLPDTRIIYLSIHLPPGRLTQAEKINEVNKLVAAECRSNPKLQFVNVHEIMLAKDGRPNLELYRDKLHPNAKAYELWAARLRPVLSGGK